MTDGLITIICFLLILSFLAAAIYIYIEYHDAVPACGVRFLCAFVGLFSVLYFTLVLSLSFLDLFGGTAHV